MLHRTRAEQVVPIYSSFLKEYPTIQDLSRAKIQSIKKVTKHLGLHWRSKHFIDAARYIVKNHAGNIPNKRDELLCIPGVGDYVAGAILTVCYGKKEYVVDSNIARFINRHYGLSLKGELRRKKEIIVFARQLFKTRRPGKLLFAIIDFTAIICKPAKPQCQRCFFNKNCVYGTKNA